MTGNSDPDFAIINCPLLFFFTYTHFILEACMHEDSSLGWMNHPPPLISFEWNSLHGKQSSEKNLECTVSPQTIIPGDPSSWRVQSSSCKETLRKRWSFEAHYSTCSNLYIMIHFISTCMANRPRAKVSEIHSLAQKYDNGIISSFPVS